MSDQGKQMITSVVPTAASVRGLAISGAGTFSATLMAVGFAIDSSAAGVVIGAVQIGGTCMAVCGVSAITAGADLQSDGAGKLIAAVDDGLACAVALEDGSAEDVLFRVKIL
jgi:hypothetical protein